jgi:starch synthase
MSAGRCLRVLFASSEAYPLAKTGGLADVCAALPTTLASLGIDVRLILPGYLSALDMTEGKQTPSDLPGGGRLIRGRMPDSGLPVYLLDRPDLSRRGGGLYQDDDKRDWPDNHMRYAAFCNAVVHVALHGDGSEWRPSLVHANDWHTGLVPAYLAFGTSASPPTVFTIHNMAYQGNFPLGAAEEIGLPPGLLATDGAEFYGQISFLKAGIRYADRLTTVSPTYAREILTPEYGVGLDGLLRSRANDLVGILNGVDYTVWDPAKDVNLAECYSVDRMAGKRVCKAAIQEEFDLERSDDVPLVSFVNRLTHQKMGDVMLQALPALLNQRIQLVVHGEGDKDLEDAFFTASLNRSSRLAVSIGYQEPLAHRLNAAADISLTPSRFEPCGLTTMYAMRYGAPPVTRSVGGLTDTVVDVSSARADEEGATGYTFTDATADELAACVQRACAGFRDKTSWRQIQRNAMDRDFSWDKSAKRYLAIYYDLLRAGERDTCDQRVPGMSCPVELSRHQYRAGARSESIARLACEGAFFSRGVEIAGRGLSGIDRDPPGSQPRRHRQDEVERHPIGIEHEVEGGPVLAVNQARQASRTGIGPVRAAATGIEPLDVLACVEGFST